MKVHVRNDRSKPQTVSKTAKGHTEFVAVPHHDKTAGYKGKFVPKTPASQKAAAKLAKMALPVNPTDYVGN
jgi:hypothetical protein